LWKKQRIIKFDTRNVSTWGNIASEALCSAVSYNGDYPSEDVSNKCCTWQQPQILNHVLPFAVPTHTACFLKLWGYSLLWGGAPVLKNHLKYSCIHAQF
jgi:hypothetical protein